MRGILRLEIPKNQSFSLTIIMNVEQARELRDHLVETGASKYYPVSDFNSLIQEVLRKMIIEVDELSPENGVPVL